VRRRSRLTLLALVMSALPLATFAAPATVTVFEAEVYAQPDRASSAIHAFVEGTRLSVSEKTYDGFRKVRLPDGKVGYIDATAVRLVRPPDDEWDEAWPSPPPPPPPPPLYPPHPRAAPDATAYRHVGLYLRFELGVGYMSATTSADETLFAFDDSHGAAGDIGLLVGGSVRENLLVGGQFWGTFAGSPTFRYRGSSVPGSGSYSTTLYGIGPNVTWYLMPANVFFSVTPSLTWMTIGDYYDDYAYDPFYDPSFRSRYETDAGFGARFAIGKDWWVAPYWGMGVSGWFAFSLNGEDASDARWETYAGGLSFTLTLN
jgi:hypothetical protein